MSIPSRVRSTGKVLLMSVLILSAQMAVYTREAKALFGEMLRWEKKKAEGAFHEAKHLGGKIFHFDEKLAVGAGHEFEKVGKVGLHAGEYIVKGVTHYTAEAIKEGVSIGGYVIGKAGHLTADILKTGLGAGWAVTKVFVKAGEGTFREIRNAAGDISTQLWNGAKWVAQ